MRVVKNILIITALVSGMTYIANASEAKNKRIVAGIQRVNGKIKNDTYRTPKEILAIVKKLSK